MTRVRSPWPEDDELTLEIKKLMAEIAKLEIEHQKLLKDNLRRWRLAGVIGPILTAIIALGGIYLAYQQVVYQGQTIKQQSETIKAQAIDRAKEARSRLLQQALSMATDPSGGPDRRISGIYQLREFWSGNSEEARIVAATLAALVTIPDSPGAASIRCAAVDAISAIFDVPNGVAIDVPRLLFGDVRTQKQGLISYQNNLLLLREEARAYPERRNYFDAYNFEFRAN